jgi:hypothetical protein
MQHRRPDEHHPASPIWDVTITAIEAFYPGEKAQDPISHALIVRIPCLRNEWGTITYVNIPGTRDQWPRYSTSDIKQMVMNLSDIAGNLYSTRASSRLKQCERVEQATVSSVRVQYNGKHMFLDRDGTCWRSTRNDGLVLSTADVIAVLSST